MFGESSGSYAWALVRMLAALGLVCVLVWLVLRLVAHRFGGLTKRDGVIKVIDQLGLGGGLRLYLVSVGRRQFSLGHMWTFSECA